MREHDTVTKESPIPDMPIVDMRNFAEIDPPVIQYYSSESRQTFVSCFDEEQIHLAYDVYIVGWLNNYESESDSNYDISKLATR